MRGLAALALVCACGRVDFAPLDEPTRFTVDTFTTSGDTYVEIPGATMTLPPQPGKRWLLLTNAYLASTKPTRVTVEARYLVDDVERGIGGVENSAVDTPGPWQHFYVVDADVAHTVRYELHDASGNSATITHLDVVAIALDAAAVAYAASDPIQPVTDSAATQIVDLDLGPLDGDYATLLLVNASEQPNQNNLYVEWRDGAGDVVMPELHQPREPWQSLLLPLRATMTTPDAHFNLFARTDGAEAGVRYARALAVRSDAFADLQFARDTNNRTSSALTLVAGASLALAPGAARDYVVLTSTRLKESCTGQPDAQRHLEIDIDGVVEQRTHSTDNCSYTATYGTLDALTVPPANVAIGWSTLNDMEVIYGGSQILALGLR